MDSQILNSAPRQNICSLYKGRTKPKTSIFNLCTDSAMDLPCDGDGVCMVCKVKAGDDEILRCRTCAAPWHIKCLVNKPETLAVAAVWECPDCAVINGGVVTHAAATDGGGGGVVAKIREIEADSSLTNEQKAKKRQELLSGKGNAGDEVDGGGLGILGDKFNCSICMHLLDRPVSTPCGHNFCLKCFEKWVGQQNKKTCAICRKAIPDKMAREPRINSVIVMAIRMAKMSQVNLSEASQKANHLIQNQDRPDKAFTTERAQRSGISNACCGKVFVTVPEHYFGPITAEYDPVRNRGVLVGDTWNNRLECMQWGAHPKHVGGIKGQANLGAQSVVLSGGYEDDEDHGDWFLYTGSGGRDLSNNKRTNREQSFDQCFKAFNEALRLTCQQGYPVRVVRSYKEKRSSYAPQEGVRYDGVYSIEKCWRKTGVQGFIVCRYLFVRCDNEPAPWTSENDGDRPRPALPPVPELDHAIDITERKGSAAWDYDEKQGCWLWKKTPPHNLVAPNKNSRKGTTSAKARLLREFSCLICRKVMVLPLSTPCGHSFCKACLMDAFAGESFVKERKCGGRTLRKQKNVMKCPSCQIDISEFLQNPQVNREVMDAIESLQNEMESEETNAETIDEPAPKKVHQENVVTN